MNPVQGFFNMAFFIVQLVAIFYIIKVIIDKFKISFKAALYAGIAGLLVLVVVFYISGLGVNELVDMFMFVPNFIVKVIIEILKTALGQYSA